MAISVEVPSPDKAEAERQDYFVAFRWDGECIDVNHQRQRACGDEQYSTSMTYASDDWSQWWYSPPAADERWEDQVIEIQDIVGKHYHV